MTETLYAAVQGLAAGRDGRRPVLRGSAQRMVGRTIVLAVGALAGRF